MPNPITPAVTTSIVIELADRPNRPIVLIERRNPPLGWALPGGFVDVGESVGSAAVREAKEETGLTVTLVQLLGCYCDPGRDPRGHTASIVYVAHARGMPTAADDARDVAVFTLERLPAELAFDHARVLVDYRAWRERGALPPP